MSVRSVVGVTGEILITVGLVLALFVVYQVWWTDLASARDQSAADADLDRRWSEPAGPDNERGHGAGSDDSAPAGAAFARLHIPALGSDYRFAVVEGTGEDELEVGPGHYPGTQMPGQPGNFAVAGHRVGRGAPFNDLDAIDSCDAVVIETRETWFVYRVLPIGPGDRALDPTAARGEAGRCLPAELADRVTSGEYAGLAGRSIVDPSDAWVVDPVPSHTVAPGPGLVPLATLTTCHPRFSARERMVLHAALVRTEPREPGRVPAEMRG